jgi:tripartite-type tricarboxylate transporter receptor subunit TctC
MHEVARAARLQNVDGSAESTILHDEAFPRKLSRRGMAGVLMLYPRERVMSKKAKSKSKSKSKTKKTKSKSKTKSASKKTAGTVELCGVTVATAVPQVKSGAAIALVQTGKERWRDLPDVPTLAQAGVADADSETYWSLYAPASTPKPVVERLAQGAGSISHLGAELLKIRANFSIVHVPFSGAGPAMQALLGWLTLSFVVARESGDP